MVSRQTNRPAKETFGRLDALNLFLFFSLATASFFRFHDLALFSLLFLTAELALFFLLGVLKLTAHRRIGAAWIYAGVVIWVFDLKFSLAGRIYDLFRSGTGNRLSAIGIVLLLLFGATILVRKILKRVGLMTLRTLWLVFSATALLAVPLSAPAGRNPPDESRAASGNAAHTNGNIYYFILDEQVGFGAFPAEISSVAALGRDLERRYQERGFTTYPRAFSNYYLTAKSIPSLLSQEVFSDDLLENHGEHYTLRKNVVFQEILNRGYRPEIYQSTFLDFCAQKEILTENCHRFHYDDLGFLKDSGLPRLEKSAILAQVFLDANIPAQSVTGRLYEHLTFRRAHNVAPINALASLQALQRLIPQRRSNTFFFAHLILPHEPYLFDAQCQVRPTQTWVASTNKEDLNSPDERARRYQLYGQQVACLHREIEKTLTLLQREGLYDSATIILHSDHGSRISLRAPSSETMPKFSEEEFRDCFGAFFAFKGANPPAQPTGPVPVARLLAEWLGKTPNPQLESVYVPEGADQGRYEMRGL